jgi:ABC-2 type transport system ATP-binding protein
VREIILELKRQGRTVFFSTHILPDAEVLCDRVAVLLGGKLQGVGTPREIMAIEVQGMEIHFEMPQGKAVPECLAKGATPSGLNYRLNVSEAQLYETIEQLHGAGARILSVTQLRPTLEDYFFKLVGQGKGPAYAIEASLTK